jgi:hypothetical protein
MSLISISEASELTGKSIPAIYQYVKNGKLATTTDNKIDTTDLFRLFGALRSATDYYRENEILHRSNADLKQDKDKLYQINEFLRASNTDLKQDKERLHRIIESQQKLPLTVNVMREQAEEPEQAEQAPSKDIAAGESLTQRLIRKLCFK